MGLPAEPFDCARLLQARVDNRARVSVRQCFYSVPARYAGRRLPVRLAARTVEIYDGARLVAHHERAVGRYVEVLCLDHYLEVLKTKPGGAARRDRTGTGQDPRRVHRIASGLLGCGPIARAATPREPAP